MNRAPVAYHGFLIMQTRLVIRLALATLLLAPATARADLIADWGNIATPITGEITFSFAQYDISRNFTDHYNFSLAGDAGAKYTVSFSFDSCLHGCGNPDIAYGIYERNGGLLANSNGSVTLSAGLYTFQVKGTGMGSGNNVDYWGDVTFAASPSSISMVSPAPEPASWLLLLSGLAVLAWHGRSRSRTGA